MHFSQDEVVECSQKSCRGAKRPTIQVRKSYTQRAPKVRTSQRHRVSRGAAAAAAADGLEIPETSTEETSANLSGSLFSGQQDLLKQYNEHEKPINQHDEVLERVLEQSRKAYEQLKIQTESRDLFTADVESVRKEVGVNTEGIERSEVAVQASQTVAVLLRDFGTQVALSRPDHTDVAIQLSPTTNPHKHRMKDAEIQLSPPKEAKKIRIDAGINTDSVPRKDATMQTMKIEKRNVAVQKYHSTRVREMSVQTMGNGELLSNLRTTGKRNVCVQQRSSAMLELNREVALTLGIELKCDPTRLLRLLSRVAVKQCSREVGESSSVQHQSTVDVEFTEDDPYWANHGYFMDDVGTDNGSISDSGLGDIEPRMSCNIEESLG